MRAVQTIVSHCHSLTLVQLKHALHIRGPFCFGGASGAVFTLKLKPVMAALQLSLRCLCLFAQALRSGRGRVPCMEVRQHLLLWQSNICECAVGQPGPQHTAQNGPVFWEV